MMLITFEEMAKLYCSMIPVGFLIGMFPFIVGLVVHGIINIFKQV